MPRLESWPTALVGEADLMFLRSVRYGKKALLYDTKFHNSFPGFTSIVMTWKLVTRLSLLSCALTGVRRSKLEQKSQKSSGRGSETQTKVGCFQSIHHSQQDLMGLFQAKLCSTKIRGKTLIKLANLSNAAYYSQEVTEMYCFLTSYAITN